MQQAIEAILRHVVGLIDAGLADTIKAGPRAILHKVVIDGQSVVRFHKSDVIPNVIDFSSRSMLAREITNASMAVNKHQLSYDPMSGWFTFRLIG